MTLTAAVESLSWAYPGRFDITVESNHPDIWYENPWISTYLYHNTVQHASETVILPMEYPSIQESNQRLIPFLGGYTDYLSSELLRRNLIPKPFNLTVNRPYLYLSSEEKSWMSQAQELTGRNSPFWLLNAGIKSDFTTKSWPLEYYHEVVRQTLGEITWVQVGSANDLHHHIPGTINLIGKTDLRQLIRLVYHCRGGLGPITLLQHLCAAWEKPYLALLGGREPISWVQYPLQHTLHTMGMLDCCLEACWKSKVETDCTYPINHIRRPSPLCMTMITPDQVLSIVRKYR